MKGLIVGLAALAVLLFGSWDANQGQAAPSTEMDPETRLAGRIEQIAGTWHAFPAGLLLQISENGSVQFGLDWDGTPSGYEAIAWFEGQDLSVRFTNYDGQNAVCASATGRYTVQLYEDGKISLAPIHDDCQFRLQILSGQPQAGFGLMYHPVQD